jgi:hypothetical protein
MNRRSFLTGLLGVAAAGTLVNWSTLPSEAVPAADPIEPPEFEPSEDDAAAPDGTPVDPAQYWRRRRRRYWRRRRRRAWRRRRVCRVYRNRWGRRVRRCRVVRVRIWV